MNEVEFKALAMWATEGAERPVMANDCIEGGRLSPPTLTPPGKPGIFGLFTVCKDTVDAMKGKCSVEPIVASVASRSGFGGCKDTSPNLAVQHALHIVSVNFLFSWTC